MAVARPLDAIEAPAASPGWLATILEFCRQRPLGAVGGAIILVMFIVAVASGPVTISPRIVRGGAVIVPEGL